MKHESQGIRIMIVEDSATQAEHLKFLLGNAGYTVSTAVNGKEALAMIETVNPHLILSDIVMPEMDGFALCHTIKQEERFRKIPVILVTALFDPQDVISGLECGANNFITKPYSEKYLLSRIQAVLETSHASETDSTVPELEITFAGKKHHITATRLQILTLLLSSYETAVHKNQELTTLNKELATTHKELRRNVDQLTRAKADLKLNNENLNNLNEKLTAAQEELHQNLEELSSREHQLSEALAEKEILLAEIHHRVKNNLTAFISLLSLEGTYDDTPGGIALKKDLQNRARSMALIHETLYQTKKFSQVDMNMYLSTLVGQVHNSYEVAKQVKTVVNAQDISLDLSRATTAGLIINELVTNAFKYAFPPPFDCETIRGSSCTISVTLAKEGQDYILTVKDNGTGLPTGIDISTTKSLGLKLVNFLARHQMRAKVEVNAACGTEFVFRFRE